MTEKKKEKYDLSVGGAIRSAEKIDEDYKKNWKQKLEQYEERWKGRR